MNRNGSPSAMKTRQLTAMPKLMLRLIVVMRQRPKVVMTKPHGDELARIEFGRERSGDGEEKHQHQSAGRDGHAGLAGGVAHDLLQKLRDQHGGRVEGDARP